MKEILYIQAGTLPNFVGTHFWNTQESYFQYDGEADPDETGEPEINHDISFREGLSPKVELQSGSSFVHFSKFNESDPLGRSHILSTTPGFRPER